MLNPSTSETPGSTIRLQITQPDQFRLAPESYTLLSIVLYAVLLLVLSLTAFVCTLTAALV